MKFSLILQDLTGDELTQLLEFATEHLPLTKAAVDNSLVPQRQEAEEKPRRRRRRSDGEASASSEQSAELEKPKRRRRKSSSDEASAPAGAGEEKPARRRRRATASSEEAAEEKPKRRRAKKDDQISDVDVAKAASEGAQHLTPKVVTNMLEEFGVGNVAELDQEQRREFVEALKEVIEESQEKVPF